MEAKRIIDKKELNEAFYIRKIVFVDEQGVPLDEEFDEYDANADHVLAYYNNQPVGTGRVQIINGAAKLERICVLAPNRKYGLGMLLIRALEKIAQDKNIFKAILHSQTHAVRFYEKFGYRSASREFLEAGIPHIVMLKDLSNFK
jgi:predicted GNAT family N-acyltransferase